jgi:hypothetical protein
MDAEGKGEGLEGNTMEIQHLKSFIFFATAV